jgi:hypothetical protein
LPFPIKKVQCDNGSEFPVAFKLAVEAAGIKHRLAADAEPAQDEVEMPNKAGSPSSTRSQRDEQPEVAERLAGKGLLLNPSALSMRRRPLLVLQVIDEHVSDVCRTNPQSTQRRSPILDTHARPLRG